MKQNMNYRTLVTGLSILFLHLSLPATFAQSNTVPVCTEEALRAAIALGGWVNINCSGTFTLSHTIDITNQVILDAQNESVVISGNNAVRLFTVTPRGSLTATNLILANGSVTNNPADGGGIYNDGGTVVLVSCVLTNNNAQVQMVYGATNVMRGGAIFNQSGAVSLFGCGISNNTATAVGLGGWSGFGGAIYSADGVVQMVGCHCISNLCQVVNPGVFSGGSALGGAVFQASGGLLVTNSVFALNQALAGAELANMGTARPASGGALCANGGIVIIDHSQFTGNISKGTDSRTVTPGSGGAIYCGATLTVESSIFAWNQALAGNGGRWYVADGQGGAIYNAGSAVLNRSSIYSNYVQGSWDTNMYADGGLQHGGDGLGGGVYNSGLLMVTNCTIALNSAIAGSGALYGLLGPAGGPGTNGNALGGGVYNDVNARSLWVNVTIASNFCIASGTNFLGTNGFSAGAQIANTNGVVWLRNSLLAYSGTNGNVWGTAVTDAGFNISDDGSAAFASGASYNFTDPRLGPLDYYGGSTPCMALLPGSPAIDTGNNAGAPATDQRGLARPYNGVVDMGAYELYGSSLPAATHYVSLRSANPTPPYTNWVTAATHIQDALNAAAANDVVLVTNGVYAGGITVTKPLTLLSVNGPQVTIIDGGAHNTVPPYGTNCVSLADSASLTGFTLTNGAGGANGGGVTCASPNAFLTNCIIVRNLGGAYGGTLYNCTLASNMFGGAYGSTLYNCTLSGNWGGDSVGGAANSTLYNCTLTQNSGGFGGGAGGGSTLYNCTLIGNTAYAGAGADSCTLYNCTLSGNSADNVGGGAAMSKLYNCTLTGNNASLAGGGDFGSTLSNCIVYSNTAAANYDSSGTLNYCCTTPLPTNGVGNIISNPLFVDSANGNLRLQSNSPCLNAGNNAYVTTATDLDGRPRIVGGTVDMGAYEFQPGVSGAFIGWLQQYGLPTDGSADYADSDHDGLNNWQEWVCGTNPTNALSALRMVSALPTSTNVTVSWQSVAAVNYFLERSGDLGSPFTLLGTNILGQAGTTSYADTNATGAGPFFYRVGAKP